MFESIKKLYRKLPSFSARFHIAFGLTSLVSTVVLVALFTGFVPDKASAQHEGRLALAEGVAATSSALLGQGNQVAVRASLQFIVGRNNDLRFIQLERAADNYKVMFSETELADTQNTGVVFNQETRISVPLLRGDRNWGQLHFQFDDNKGVSLLDRMRDSPFGLMGLMSLLCFPLFYFYLGKMLKELNPSQAVPGRVRSALDTIAESLLVIDRKGDVVLANAAFADLNGVQAESLLGLPVEKFDWIFEDQETLETPWQQALTSGEPVRHEMIGFIDSDSQERKFILNCSPVMGGNGKAGGVLISMDDVTLLEEKEILLRQSMEEAEAANQAKSAFLSNMSHEIRTPMTAILGFTEVLKRGYIDSEQDRLRHLNTIANSGQHLLELINDVLDLSKVESGAMEVEEIATNAPAIVNEVIKVLRVKAEEKGIFLKMEISSDLPESIQSDPSRLRQVVTNLVGNAIKFTEQGGVTIDMRFTGSSEIPLLHIDVHDTGIGMSAKHQATIFDAFTQADASITRRFGGTGLGLSISRSLAIAMGGNVTVESEEGRGSCFQITVPVGDIASTKLLKPAQILEELETVETGEHMQWSFPDSRVLVVDDGAENRELLSLVLADLGIQVELGCNGQEAIDALEKEQFDVVLMDVQMPVMDGYEAVGQIRKRGWTVPVVALTANAMKGFEQKILEAGYSHYMPKPIDLDKLSQLLAELLGGQQLEVEQMASVATRSSDAKQDEDKIYSPLAADNPKFQKIVEQFIARLDGRLIEMDQAHAEADFEKLGKLAHWLKGSGGTVGFNEFYEPAQQLEKACIALDTEAATPLLNTIRKIQSRLSTGSHSGSYEPENNLIAAKDEQPITNVTIATTSVDKKVDKAIVSSLPMDNPRFRAVVERFIPRLEDQVCAMQDALNREDFEELANLAHWLKGSGGNVGFHHFTDFAAELEQGAKNGDSTTMVDNLAEIVQLTKRVRAGWDSLPALKKTA